MHTLDSSVHGLRISMGSEGAPTAATVPWASMHPPTPHIQPGPPVIPPRPTWSTSMPAPGPSYHDYPPQPQPDISHSHAETAYYYPTSFPDGGVYPPASLDVAYSTSSPSMPYYASSAPFSHSTHQPTSFTMPAQPPMLEEMSQILAQREALLKQQLAMTAMLRQAQARAGVSPAEPVSVSVKLSPDAPSFQPSSTSGPSKSPGVVRLGTTIQAPASLVVGPEEEENPDREIAEPRHRTQRASVPARRVASDSAPTKPQLHQSSKRVSFASSSTIVKRRAMSLSAAAMDEASKAARTNVGVASAECAMRRLREAGVARRLSNASVTSSASGPSSRLAYSQTPWALASGSPAQ